MEDIVTVGTEETGIVVEEVGGEVVVAGVEEVLAEEVEDSEETVGEMVEAVWKDNNLEEAWELWIGTE